MILFILIRFDFDYLGITVHPQIIFHLRIKIKSNQKSKVGESIFTHFRIIGWFDFESKANQTVSRIELVRALTLILSSIGKHINSILQPSHKEELLLKAYENPNENIIKLLIDLDVHKGLESGVLPTLLERSIQNSKTKVIFQLLQAYPGNFDRKEALLRLALAQENPDFKEWLKKYLNVFSRYYWRASE